MLLYDVNAILASENSFCDVEQDVTSHPLFDCWYNYSVLLLITMKTDSPLSVVVNRSNLLRICKMKVMTGNLNWRLNRG